jgi:hypothetical protein
LQGVLTGASNRFWQSRQNTVKPKFDATAAFESESSDWDLLLKAAAEKLCTKQPIYPDSA